MSDQVSPELHPQSKVAIVTGAGSGIGKASSIALADSGFHLVLVGRHEESLQETAKQCRKRVDDVDGIQVIPTDVCLPESVQLLFETVERLFGRVDVLFNNAGISAPEIEIDQLTIDQWEDVIQTNLTGPFLCAAAAIKLMKKQSPRGGRIINNGSLAATTPRPHATPYTVSKHGMTGLTKSIALDGRPYDISASQIDIGNAATTMAAGHGGGALQAGGETIIEPLMDVEHVARAVVQIAQMPLDANILQMTVMATKMPFVGRG